MQAGEGEGAESFERRVLHGKLLESPEAAKGERLHLIDGVAVQIEFAQRFVALERVRLQLADVVLDERKVFHVRWQILGNLAQPTAITQHLFFFLIKYHLSKHQTTEKATR